MSDQLCSWPIIGSPSVAIAATSMRRAFRVCSIWPPAPPPSHWSLANRNSSPTNQASNPLQQKRRLNRRFLFPENLLRCKDLGPLKVYRGAMTRHSVKNFLLLIALVSAFAFGGCTGNDNSTNPIDSGGAILPGNQVQAPLIFGFLRIAHLSPDAPNVDVQIDGQVVASNVPFRTFGSYLRLAPGQYRVQIFPTGGANAVIDVNVTVTASTFQTVAATNVVANIAGTTLQDTVLNTTNNALVRVFHASPDAGAVDLTLADGTVLAGNLTFPNASQYLTLAPGTYNLQIRQAGTANIIRDFQNVTLTAGQTLTATAVGQVADLTFDVLVAVDTAADGSLTIDLQESLTSVRAAHLASDVAAVDVLIDGVAVATNVTFPAVGAYVTTPSRFNGTVVVRDNATQNQLLTINTNLAIGGAATFAAVGSNADGNVALVEYTDDRVGAAGSAQVRAVHAGSDVAAIDAIANGTNVATALTFPNASNYVNVVPATGAPVTINLNGGGQLFQTNVDLNDSATYSAFVAGRAGDASAVLLIVQDSP